MPDPTSRAEATELSRPPDADVPVGADAPIIDVMATMRAMRRLSPEPIPREVVERIVRAATWAPSGSNGQHYAFVAVTDRAVMRRLADLWREVVDTYATLAGTVVPGLDDDRHSRMADAIRYQADHFHETPLVIAACYRKSTPSASSLLDLRRGVTLARRLGARRLARLGRAAVTSSGMAEASSIYPAVQNLLLAARAEGLGATLTVWHLFDEQRFRKVLGVPDDHGIYAIIPIGRPLGRFGPVRRRPVDEVLHWEHW
ncbi:MAG: nitroreductase family protein [Ilumatobacteraceae bacterium]